MSKHEISPLAHVAIVIVTAVIALGVAEAAVRLKNADQKNYYVEMWRYAKELKKTATDPRVGHVHIDSKSEKLQDVDVAINSWGMRGPEPMSDGRKRILLLGSSITLGWGVPEQDTLRAKLEQELSGRAQVFNGGVGNYNSTRYVALFETRLKDLKPDIVVVQYFLRDAELLPPDRNSFLLEHSMLAALGFHALDNLLHGSSGGIDAIKSHYAAVYASDSPGRQAMIAALNRLAELSKQMGFKVVLAITPDIHQLDNYPFSAIHEQMSDLAKHEGWQSVDFLPALSVVPSKDLYAIPGDPHPNAIGHQIMAKTLLPVLTKTLDALP